MAPCARSSPAPPPTHIEKENARGRYRTCAGPIAPGSVLAIAARRPFREVLGDAAAIFVARTQVLEAFGGMKCRRWWNLSRRGRPADAAAQSKLAARIRFSSAPR